MDFIVDIASDEEMYDINLKYIIKYLEEEILKTYTIGKTFELHDIFNLCVTNPNYDGLNKYEKQKICSIAIIKLLNDKIIEEDPSYGSTKDYIVVKEIQHNKKKKEDYEK